MSDQVEMQSPTEATEAVKNDDTTQSDSSQVQAPVEGSQNPAYEPEPEAESDELPPLTYIDFEPRCLGSTIEGKEPSFDPFSTLVEQANQWLLAMPQFTVVRCETIQVRLGTDFKLDSDCCITRISSYGRNVYLKTLRLWLVPKADTNSPVQQLAYMTVLPQHSSGDLSEFLTSLSKDSSRTLTDKQISSFDNLTTTVEKLNKFLQAKPIPGKLLTVESVSFKCQENNTADQLDAEATTCSENGSNSKMFLNALRIFYVVGQPAFETIGIHDEKPDIHQSREGMGLKIKFATFDQTVVQANQWLNQQQGIRVVNMQSVTVKLERRNAASPWVLDSTMSGYTEGQTLQEQRYAKVLRIVYVTDQKLEIPTPHSSITLTTRLFAPNKMDGRIFESFSKTQLRVIKWLNATKLPLFGMETVRFAVATESNGKGYNENRVDYLVNTYHGQQYVTCIRLYFPCVFEEPPPEVTPEEDQGWGAWGCVVS